MALDFGPETRQIPSLSPGESGMRHFDFGHGDHDPFSRADYRNAYEDLNSLKDGVTTYKKSADVTQELYLASSNCNFVPSPSGVSKQGIQQ